jgi:cytochrome c oxidase assembly protein subunit 19
MAQPAKRPQPKAPELGAFPLDHFRECKEEVQRYYVCLEKNNRITPMCRDEVKDYLNCRMDRGLMNKTDMSKFGIPKTEFVPARLHKDDTVRDAVRGGGGAQWVPAAWEAKFKNRELERDDGYEIDKATGNRVVFQGDVYVPSRVKGDTI